MNKLPNHLVERSERRWASTLARAAVAWRSEKPSRSSKTEIVDRAGRLIPVTFKRTTLPLPSRTS